jgi:hypothetical protein
MEISPVANVRIPPVVQSKDTDLGMTDVDDVESVSRIGDETYTPSGEESAPGERSQDSGEGRQNDEDTYSGSAGEAEAEATPEPTLPSEPDGQIDVIV